MDNMEVWIKDCVSYNDSDYNNFYPNDKPTYLQYPCFRN
jgi:hypothetical protein